MSPTSSADPVPHVRWGIVGASDIADRVMAPAMVEAAGAVLVAVASRSKERADWFARRHLRRAVRADLSAAPLRTYATAADLAADPAVDAVYVATEVDRHLEGVLAAAAHGKDVLVEKPIARSAAEAQQMIDACREAGVRLGTCYYKRYNARHQRMRQLIAEGALGTVAAASADYSGRVPGTEPRWRRDPEQSGGGPVIDGASHVVDLLRFLLADEVAAVTAVTSDRIDGGPVEDTAFAILRFRSGALASIASHWSITDVSDRRTNAIRIAGTEGTLEGWPLYEKHSRGTLLLADGAGEREVETPVASTHVAFLDAMAAARANNAPFPVTGEDGLRAAQVIDAIYESARTGRQVEIQ